MIKTKWVLAHERLQAAMKAVVNADDVQESTRWIGDKPQDIQDEYWAAHAEVMNLYKEQVKCEA